MSGGERKSEFLSPCIQVCFVDPRLDHCIGCWRSMTEIGSWSKMSDDERAQIMDELKTRAPALKRQFYEMRGLAPPEDSA